MSEIAQIKKESMSQELNNQAFAFQLSSVLCVARLLEHGPQNNR
jgi:hypothetical protein